MKYRKLSHAEITGKNALISAKGIAIVLLVALSTVGFATTRYVNVNNSNPMSPYTSWATAATNIQDAIDIPSFGATLILVTNGVFQTGGRVANGSTATTNRVSLDWPEPVTVQSVNGPAVTIIQGYQLPGSTNGDSAIRCAYLTAKASLIGFTLTNGATGTNLLNVGSYVGGGAYSSGVLSNCVIVGNAAFVEGGGALSGTYENCLFTGNTAPSGGAVVEGILNNCTVTGNSASIEGGGLFDSGGAGTGSSPPMSANNCIVYGNTAPVGSNYYPSTMVQLNFSCTTPMSTNGLGNITNDPAFVNPAVNDFHLQSNSPCINAGENAYAPSGSDLDGNPRIVGGTVDMGAYEYQTPTSIISYA